MLTLTETAPASNPSPTFVTPAAIPASPLRRSLLISKPLFSESKDTTTPATTNSDTGKRTAMSKVSSAPQIQEQEMEVDTPTPTVAPRSLVPRKKPLPTRATPHVATKKPDANTTAVDNLSQVGQQAEQSKDSNSGERLDLVIARQRLRHVEPRTGGGSGAAAATTTTAANASIPQANAIPVTRASGDEPIFNESLLFTRRKHRFRQSLPITPTSTSRASSENSIAEDKYVSADALRRRVADSDEDGSDDSTPPLVSKLASIRRRVQMRSDSSRSSSVGSLQDDE